MTHSYQADESFALECDRGDSAASRREHFHIPARPDGQPSIYLAGNSLGLQPRGVRAMMERELADWAELGVEGHFRAERPWFPYHEALREPGGRLIGALPDEVVFMNGLTVNLHLLMISFYRPTRERYKILVEDASFPSDTYAVRTQVRLHGLAPESAIVTVRPRAGEHAIRMDDVEELIEREKETLALVLMPGVHYFTGQVMDIRRIAAAARRAGARVGFDLAHAVGNIELRLHDWEVDFAVWCCYKYLNGGPGAAAGAYVHERHLRDASLPRLGGWWGNDPATRFRMHLEPEFVPVARADAWALSNPPIFSMLPVRASLAIFDEVGMAALRARSLRLTGFLRFLLDQVPSRRAKVITPREAEGRGCQLSILAHERPRELFRALEVEGVMCDFREPNVIRVAPTPLYNTYHEAWRFAQVFHRHA